MTLDPTALTGLPQIVEQHLERAEPDLMRELLRTFVQALMSAEADAGRATVGRVLQPTLQP